MPHIVCSCERVVDFARFAALLMAVASQSPGPPSPELPMAASAQLQRSLMAATQHTRHIWRDSPAMNADGTVNAYIEIPRGERRKFEFDMLKHERFIDRVMPDALGGYPVNYGFVPQTVSYDGDPFDALVLGPPLPGGTLVKGAIVGLMHMEDEKGVDSKVVLSLLGPQHARQHQLRAADQARIGDYFRRYKQHEPGKFSKVPGWDSAELGRQFVQMTHRFFLDCQTSEGKVCRVSH